MGRGVPPGRAPGPGAGARRRGRWSVRLDLDLEHGVDTSNAGTMNRTEPQRAGALVTAGLSDSGGVRPRRRRRPAAYLTHMKCVAIYRSYAARVQYYVSIYMMSYLAAHPTASDTMVPV